VKTFLQKTENKKTIGVAPKKTVIGKPHITEASSGAHTDRSKKGGDNEDLILNSKIKKTKE
jgi:hypothetical protein